VSEDTLVSQCVFEIVQEKVANAVVVPQIVFEIITAAPVTFYYKILELKVNIDSMKCGFKAIRYAKQY
jgi:hypothetical protein